MPRIRKTQQTENGHKAPARLGARQERILTLLKAAGEPLRMKVIAEGARVDPAFAPAILYGALNKEQRPITEARWGVSLLTLGHVREKVIKVEGKAERFYEITKSGKKALANHQEAQAAKEAAAV